MDAHRVIRRPSDAPAVLRLGRIWLSASFRGGILLFLPWLARLVVLPNGRVSADGSSGRRDDERVVHDFKLEPTARQLTSVCRGGLLYSKVSPFKSGTNVPRLGIRISQ